MHRNKRVGKITWIVLVLMVCSMLFTGCGAVGSIYTLTELYENKFLSRDDIMNIAYHRTSKVQIVKDDSSFELEEVAFDPSYWTTEAFPDGTIEIIVKDYKKKFEAEKKYKLSECKILHYFGTYNGFMVVEIYFKIREVDMGAVEKELTVSDIYLGSASMQRELIAWRNNVG